MNYLTGLKPAQDIAQEIERKKQLRKEESIKRQASTIMAAINKEIYEHEKKIVIVQTDIDPILKEELEAAGYKVKTSSADPGSGYYSTTITI